MIAALVLSVALLDTPTPTPTPGPNNAPVSSFNVPPQQPPWAIPVLPTWGTGTPVATLYAATPAHGTEYPGQVGTATAQIGQFTEPLSSVSTPVSAVIGAGPTQTAGDVNTGLDPTGTGTISLSTITDMIADGVEDTVATAKALVEQISDMITYAPWIAAFPVIAFLPTVIGVFLQVIIFIIRAGKWLWRWGTDFFAFIGIWVRG